MEKDSICIDKKIIYFTYSFGEVAIRTLPFIFVVICWLPPADLVAVIEKLMPMSVLVHDQSGLNKVPLVVRFVECDVNILIHSKVYVMIYEMTSVHIRQLLRIS